MNYTNRKGSRVVEAEGFRDGTQDVDPTIAVKEIEAQFAQRQEHENQSSGERIKSLEGRVETLRRRKEDSERHWADLEFRTEGMPPQIVLPLCGVTFAAAAVAGEAIFLAPVMDGFGIADPTFQFVFAAVIVITTSGLFEITKKIFSGRSFDRQTAQEEPLEPSGEQQDSRRLGSRIFFGVMTTLAFALVFILGWWRAEEMIYAASVQTGAWKDFLTENPALTRAVVVLLTTALPIFVAMTFEWGLNGLHLAWEWRKSRTAYRRYGKLLDATQKALEGQIESNESRKKALEQMGEEWKQAYLQNHELGQKTGAWKLPLWRVALKICAVGLLVSALCLLVDPLVVQYIESGGMRCLLYACLTLGVGVLYASHAMKAWDRPTSAQLYAQKATTFRSEEKPQSNSTNFVLSPASPVEGNGKQPVETATGARGHALT